MKYRKIVYLVILVLSFLIFPGKSGLVKEVYACTPGPYCVPDPVTCGACSPSCGPGNQTCSNCCSSWGNACNNGPCCSDSAPDIPVPSSPANGSMVTSLTGNQVSWSSIASWGTNCAGNNNTYTVYLDTNPNPATVLCSVTSATTSCTTGTLSDSSLYRWKVVASNGVLSSTSSIWDFYSPYTVFGWIYKETDNSITRATEASEGLLPNYLVNLSQGKTGSYTSAGSAVGGYVGNYYFQELLNNTIYKIELQITPTGSILYPDGLHTNPYYVQSLTQSQYVDFPFVTVTPRPIIIPSLGIPTHTPTQTPAPAPSDPPTPTPILPTITPGGPTLTPTPTITPGGPTLTSTPTPTITPGGPTLTPTPTITPGGPSLTPTPTITPGGPTLTPTPTITPGGPTLTPTPTITPGGPTLTSTPTPTITPGGPTLTPTPTITPGGPTLTPTPTLVPGCLYLPTPNIQGPADQSCTNIKPNFSAIVSNPNNDSVWAKFYTNYFETFSRMGSVQPNSGGTSVWIPDGSVLNFTGGYWWSAYAESPSCPRSGDAEARLLNMDYSAPPSPAKPFCTLVEQDITTGMCNFKCSWSAVSENDSSCSDTNNYHPVYWNTPGPGNWDAGWLGNLTSQTVYDIPSGQSLNMQLEARDGLGNASSVSESSGPFICPAILPSSTPIPTPTSILPTAPASCDALPTPVFEAPGHGTCTNTRPTFSAVVSNPNKDSAWAKFYSNYHEKFNQIGSAVAPAGGSSTWTPSNSNLYINGDYWWTAYTESPSCPRSADAPAALLSMDYSPPPQPRPPTCVLKSQDVAYSGTCTFQCSWEANLENDGTCANTNEYWPSYTNSPGPGGWGAHKVMTPILSEEVQNVPDGQSIITKMYAKDGAGNISDVSAEGGPYTCPKINTGPTITPGGPTLIPTSSPTPSITPSPTITPTPSPGVWLQLVGGDVYQKSVNQDALPAGQTFLAPISSPNNPGSSGIVLWKDSVSINGGTSSISSNNWNVKLDQGLTNQYSFQYYWEALKNKAVNLPNKSVIGDPTDLTGVDNIYYYGTYGYTQLSQSFTQPAAPKTSVTIFLISGSLEITKNFSIASNQTVVFVVSGNILVDSGVTNIPGLYISSGIFTVAAGSQPIVINGMVYAKNINLNREYRSYTIPTYQFIYQPKYFIALLPYLGRGQVNWQEVKP